LLKKRKRLGKRDKWIHRAKVKPKQSEINGVNGCQEKTAAYFLRIKYPKYSTFG
jgi:hypothetical protein